MNGSNLLNEADKKPFLLCPICLRKLEAYLNLRDTVPKRYRSIINGIEMTGNPMFTREKTTILQILSDFEDHSIVDKVEVHQEEEKYVETFKPKPQRTFR